MEPSVPPVAWSRRSAGRMRVVLDSRGLTHSVGSCAAPRRRLYTAWLACSVQCVPSTPPTSTGMRARAPPAPSCSGAHCTSTAVQSASPSPGLQPHSPRHHRTRRLTTAAHEATQHRPRKRRHIGAEVSAGGAASEVCECHEWGCVRVECVRWECGCAGVQLTEVVEQVGHELQLEAPEHAAPARRGTKWSSSHGRETSQRGHIRAAQRSSDTHSMDGRRGTGDGAAQCSAQLVPAVATVSAGLGVAGATMVSWSAHHPLHGCVGKQRRGGCGVRIAAGCEVVVAQHLALSRRAACEADERVVDAVLLVLVRQAGKGGVRLGCGARGGERGGSLRLLCLALLVTVEQLPRVPLIALLLSRQPSVA